MYRLTLLLVTSCAYGQIPQTVKEKQYGIPQGRQLPFYGGAPHFPGPLNYDPYLNPQLQYGGYYPGVPENQGLPVQPQVLYYPGGPGQPFLLNPGSPPGNFLIPQPQPQPQPQPHPGLDPNLFRGQPFPQRPIFVAGYPKPAHIPPTDKDAEEIPTDPKQIPPQRPAEMKPEKIELDESEPEIQKPVKPKKPVRNLVNLRPGQRFFILNGQPLFSNYPLGSFQSPERYNQYEPFFIRQVQPYKPAETQKVPIQDLFLRNAITGQIANVRPQQEVPVQKNYIEHRGPEKAGVFLRDALPLQLHNQAIDKTVVPVVLRSQGLNNDITVQSRYYEKGLPLTAQVEENPLPIYEGNVNPGIAFDYYRYNDGVDDDNDSVVIDAKVQDISQDDSESEAIESESARPVESSVAQAQPGAIALAGPGGVAAAGPRGTALAGEGGLAVSSPQATAVAGPKRDEEEKPKPKKQKQ